MKSLFKHNSIYKWALIAMFLVIIALMVVIVQLKYKMKITTLMNELNMNELKLQQKPGDYDYQYFPNGTQYNGDIQIFFSPVDIDSRKTNSVIRVDVGDVIEFFAEEWGSTGLWFKLECDSTAFKVTDEMVYCHPELANQPGIDGGDGGTRVYKLETLKKGVFSVKCVRNYRFTNDYSKSYKVIVGH